MASPLSENGEICYVTPSGNTSHAGRTVIADSARIHRVRLCGVALAESPGDDTVATLSCPNSCHSRIDAVSHCQTDRKRIPAQLGRFARRLLRAVILHVRRLALRIRPWRPKGLSRRTSSEMAAEHSAHSAVSNGEPQTAPVRRVGSVRFRVVGITRRLTPGGSPIRSLPIAARCFRAKPASRCHIVWSCAAVTGIAALLLLFVWQVSMLLPSNTDTDSGRQRLNRHVEQSERISAGRSESSVSTETGDETRLAQDKQDKSKREPKRRIRAKRRNEARPTGGSLRALRLEARPLTLEIVRAVVPQPEGETPERFLVTSLNSPADFGDSSDGACGAKVAKTFGIGVHANTTLPKLSASIATTARDHSLFSAPDGWTAVRWEDDRGSGTVIPARYTVSVGVETRAKRRPVESSTASLLVPVHEPRLNCRVVVLNRRALRATGQAVMVRLLVTNAGAVPVDDIVLHVDLSAELTYHLGRRLEHEVGRLEPGETHVVRLTPTVVRTGRATITCRLFSPDVEASAKTTLTIAGD